jgi:hypothetical protein
MAGRLIRIAVASMLLGWLASTASAQDTLLSELYGQGVHAYFSGDSEKAHQLFTMAIDQGSRDPRCFYFRGLAYHRLGRPEEGVNDFKKGAELEAAGEAVQVDVGSSLQRVQGPTRLELENYRYRARLTAHVEDVRTRQERYEQFRSDEPRVIRRPDAGIEPMELPSRPAPDPSDPFAADPDAEAPAAAPAETTVAEPPEPAVEQPMDPSEDDDPFADPPEPVVVPPADDAAPTVEAEEEADDDDPFGAMTTPAGDLFDIPAAAATPEEDLFGAPAAEAEEAAGLLFDEPMEPAAEPAAQDADPFGAPAPAVQDDDPFGAPAPAAGEDLFGEPMEPEAAPAAEDDDPFGAPAPAAGDDLFGEPMEPEAEPAAEDDDPFGAPPTPPAPAAGPFGAPPAPGAPQPADDLDPFADDEPMEDDAEEEADEEEADDDADPFGG